MCTYTHTGRFEGDVSEIVAAIGDSFDSAVNEVSCFRECNSCDQVRGGGAGEGPESLLHRYDSILSIMFDLLSLHY